MNPNGIVQWFHDGSNDINSSPFNRIPSIDIDGSNNVYLGYAQSTNNSYSPTSGTVSKLNSDGVFQWSSITTNNLVQANTSVAVTTDGFSYLVYSGTVSSYVYIMVDKFTPNGTILWETSGNYLQFNIIPNAGNYNPGDITTDEEGNCYVVYYNPSTITTYVFKLNAKDGYLNWISNVSSNSLLSSIDVDCSNNVYISTTIVPRYTSPSFIGILKLSSVFSVKNVKNGLCAFTTNCGKLEYDLNPVYCSTKSVDSITSCSKHVKFTVPKGNYIAEGSTKSSQFTASVLVSTELTIYASDLPFVYGQNNTCYKNGKTYNSDIVYVAIFGGEAPYTVQWLLNGSLQQTDTVTFNSGITLALPELVVSPYQYNDVIKIGNPGTYDVIVTDSNCMVKRLCFGIVLQGDVHIIW